MVRRFAFAAFQACRSAWQEPVKRISAVALIGCALIAAVAWKLADSRIAVCHMADSYTSEANCIIGATAARDHVLTGGMAVGLSIVVMAMVAGALVRRRQGSGGSQQRAPAVSRSARTNPTAKLPATTGQPLAQTLRRVRQRYIPILAGAALGMAATTAVLWATGSLRPRSADPYAAQSRDVSDPYADLIPNRGTADAAEVTPGSSPATRAWQQGTIVQPQSNGTLAPMNRNILAGSAQNSATQASASPINTAE